MPVLGSMFGCIECENPNPKLDSFLGRLTVWSCKEGDETEVGLEEMYFSRLNMCYVAPGMFPVQ